MAATTGYMKILTITVILYNIQRPSALIFSVQAMPSTPLAAACSHLPSTQCCFTLGERSHDPRTSSPLPHL